MSFLGICRLLVQEPCLPEQRWKILESFWLQTCLSWTQREWLLRFHEVCTWQQIKEASPRWIVGEDSNILANHFWLRFPPLLSYSGMCSKTDKSLVHQIVPRQYVKVCDQLFASYSKRTDMFFDFFFSLFTKDASHFLMMSIVGLFLTTLLSF